MSTYFTSISGTFGIQRRLPSISGNMVWISKLRPQVFFDRLVYVEDASVPDEARDAAIGMTETFMLLLVVHVHYENSMIRIISARKATKKERRTYENSK